MAKTTLKQRKAKPNSKYWRDKADTAWSDEIRKTGVCEICGKDGGIRKEDGAPVVGLQAHHLILRGRFKYRFDLSNGVCLCIACHGAHPNFRNKKRNAHGSDEARKAFWLWLEENRSGQWQWFKENEDDKRQMDGTYQDKYNELTQ